MNKEQYNYLLKFKDHMKIAQTAGYCRNIQRKDRARIKSIVEQLTKEKYTQNIYCNPCLIEMLLLVKKHFDKYEEKLNKKNTPLNTTDHGETQKI